MNELIFSNNSEGRREFAQMVSALQEACARFTVSQSTASLIIVVKSGEE